MFQKSPTPLMRGPPWGRDEVTFQLLVNNMEGEWIEVRLEAGRSDWRLLERHYGIPDPAG